MAGNNFQLPDDFPDLSLPERADRPPDMSPERVSRNPLPPPGKSSSPLPETQRTWNIGDRVLAPWEPMFLYAGTISRIEEGQALIEFDDGDAGAVFLDQLSPIQVPPGTRLLARRGNGKFYSEAVALELRGDKVRLKFDDAEEWLPVAVLRIPCTPFSEAAAQIRMGELHQRPMFDLSVGARVWAPWMPETLFPGTVQEIAGQEVKVHFDDGDRGWVQINQIAPLEFFPGMKFFARRSGNNFQVATLVKLHNDQLLVVYEDGHQQWTGPGALAMPCQPFGPPARNASILGRFAGWSWALWLGFILLFALLRAGCR